LAIDEVDKAMEQLGDVELRERSVFVKL
jgi:hypothetical protein